MSMKLSVHLPDRISKNIKARATETGTTVERVIADALKRTFSIPPASSKRPTEPERALYALIAAGLLRPAKQASPRSSRRISGKRRTELARAFSKGRPLSEIVIEDRGERV